MRTAHDVAVALAVMSILLFIIGFLLMVATVIMVFAPNPQPPLDSGTAIQYLLGITIFEAASAIPCAVISFAIEVSS